MVALASGAIGYLGVLVVGMLSLRFPGITLVGYARRIVGRWLGGLVGILVAADMIGMTVVDLHNALKAVIGPFFVTTPIWAIVSVMALVAIFFTWSGAVHASRLGPVLMIFLLLVFILALPSLFRWINFGYLIPLFDPTPIQTFQREFAVALLAFRSATYLTFLIPYIKHPQKALKAISWGYWLGWLVVFLAVIIPVMVFGPEGAKALAQPFPFVIAIIRLPNFPFEKLELLARLGYNGNVLYAVGFAYFGGGLLLSEVFHTRRVQPFMVGMLVAGFIPLMLVQGEIYEVTLARWLVIVGQLLLWTIYLLLWLVYWVRGLNRQGPYASGGSITTQQ